MTLVAEEDAVKAKQKEKIDKIRTEKAKAKNINLGKFDPKNWGEDEE